MHKRFQRLAVLLLLAAAACAPATSNRPVVLVPARRVERELPPPPAMPTTIAVADQNLTPGVFGPIDTMRRKPAADAAAKTPLKSTSEIIAQAHRAAVSTPRADGFFNAIQQYVYTPGLLYQVYCATWHMTDIALQPGEKHVGPLVVGDSLRWALGVTKSSEAGVEQEHVIVKPKTTGVTTNLTINTNRRQYFLELHAYEDETYMVAVQFLYPQDELDQFVKQANEQQQRARSTVPLNPADLNFRYALEILQGDPRWLPTQIFDDGRKTYIRFPASVRSREVPVLFVVQDGELQLVNFFPHGEFYVVDRLFDLAELRVGQKHQEIVRVERMRR